MSIWFNKAITIETIAPISKNTLGEHIGMQFSEIGEDYLKATMLLIIVPTSLMVYCTAVPLLHWQKHWAVFPLHWLLTRKNLFVLV
jgi:hypothetical protein